MTLPVVNYTETMRGHSPLLVKITVSSNLVFTVEYGLPGISGVPVPPLCYPQVIREMDCSLSSHRLMRPSIETMRPSGEYFFIIFIIYRL
uniref:Ovule protein n=1 Tax=Heterorhabditis bacteriophora TaxID=37862 RepID=A0A1I7WBQ0_HETBA